MYYLINECSLRKEVTPISLKIKQEAIKLFAQKGYEGTSVKDITQIIGIKPSALYSHFNSKEELFLNILSESWNSLMDNIIKVLENDDKRSISQVLYETQKNFFNFFKEDREKTIFIIRSLMFPPIELKNTILDLYLKKITIMNHKLKEIFEAGIKNGILKNISIDEHTIIFTHARHSFYFNISTLNKDFSMEDFEFTWIQYWNQIKAK